MMASFWYYLSLVILVPGAKQWPSGIGRLVEPSEEAFRNITLNNAIDCVKFFSLSSALS